MLHRFDLHIHSWYSPDAVNPPEVLIAAARAAGLSGIAITDHDSCEVHEYLLEQGLERADGLPVDGFLVLPGIEVSTADGHLLCIGTTLPPLRHHPAIEVFAEIMKRGGIAIPAHPYDGWRAGISEAILDQLPLEAIEIFNAAVTSRSYNEEARSYAERRGIVGTAGSDAHHANAVGTAVTSVDIEELNAASVLAALRCQVQREERYLTRLQGLQKNLGNWLRFGKRQHPPKKRPPTP